MNLPTVGTSLGASLRCRVLLARLPTLALLSTLFARDVCLAVRVAACVAAGAGAGSWVLLRVARDLPAGAVEAGAAL
jgi:hypothetical protein